MKLTIRQNNILKVIIKLYNETGKPISSKQLAPFFKISSSMLRYELRILQTFQYISKENKSSGRVPTSSGYRHFINEINFPLNSVKNKDTNFLLKKLENLFKQKNKSPDQILNESLDILNLFTKTLAFGKIAYKQVYLQDFKVYVINKNPSKLNLMFVFSNGEVVQQIIDVNQENENHIVKRNLETLLSNLINTEINDLPEQLTFINQNIKVILKEGTLDLEFIKIMFVKIISEYKLITNFNSIINFFETEEDIIFLKQIIEKFADKSIFKFLSIKSPIAKQNATIFLSSDDDLQKNIVIEKTFKFKEYEKTIYLISKLNQDYYEMLNILNFIDKNIKQF